MTSTPTVEEFLTRPEPDEPEAVEIDVATLLGVDPLISIAESLRAITSIVVRRDRQEAAEDETQQALDQLDREYAEIEKLHDVKQQLIEDTLKICSKSTSKLADSIRALLEAPVAAPTTDHPAHDADVEEWRAYARSRGYQGPDVDTANRSSIRTMLGIPQPEPES